MARIFSLKIRLCQENDFALPYRRSNTRACSPPRWQAPSLEMVLGERRNVCLLLTIVRSPDPMKPPSAP